MSWFGPQCPRCDQRNAKEAEYCYYCGISMTPLRPVILKENRWEAAQDEFAVFFKSKDVKGLFTKNLRVPTGMQGWVLQDNNVEALQEGEYNLESFPERLNSFFTGKHAEILISRSAALSLPFRFDDIPSAELLQVTVETNIHVRLGDLAAFRTHFMLRAGAVTVPQLRDLLAPSIRQILVENLAKLHLEEMSSQTNLRQQLGDSLRRELQHRFNGYGLAFDAVDTLSIRHDRYDANRNLMGSLWLDYDEKKQQADHQKALDELYSQQEWAKIKSREEELRRRYRNAELTQEEAEFAHVIRLRELDLFEKISAASTREESIRLGAREKVEQLEHDYTAKRRQREQSVLRDHYQAEDEETAWARTRELAAIQHEITRKAQEARREEAGRLEKMRIENDLKKIGIEGEINRARLWDDEEARRQKLKAEAEKLVQAAARENSLEEARHQVALDEQAIAKETRRRQVAREQSWEDKQMEEKIAAVELRIQANKEKQDLEREKTRHESGIAALGGLMKLKNDYDTQQLELALKGEKQKLEIRRSEQELKDEAEEKALERKRREQEAARKAKLEDNEHEKEILRTRGSLPAEALISVTESPEALSALLDLAKTKVLVGATPEHIQAILATRVAQAAREDSASPAFQSMASPAADPLAEALRVHNKEVTETFKWMAERDDRKWTETLTKISGISEEISKTAIGVAQAQSATQPVPQYAPQHFATAPSSQSTQSFGMPMEFKNCTGCGAINIGNARVCGQCAKAF